MMNRETKKFNNRAIDAIREFWMLFLQKSITSAAFHRAAKEMDLHSQRAVSVYKVRDGKSLKLDYDYQVSQKPAGYDFLCLLFGSSS